MDQKYQAIHSYYSQAHAPEHLGSVPFGDGGRAEVEYRHSEEVRHLKRMIAFSRQQTVLELGSGNGRWAVALAPLVGRYVGVDFSPTMVAAARQRAAQCGLNNVTFCEAAIQDYTPAHTFDIIYLSGVSQHLHDVDLKVLLGGLHARLATNGTVVDRSTVHQTERLVLEEGNYFSVYRTANEVVELFDGCGWCNYYRKSSYRPLWFPPSVRSRTAGRKFARLVIASAPVSFYLLRAWAIASGDRYRRTAEFSHDFFLFRPKAQNDSRGGSSV